VSTTLTNCYWASASHSSRGQMRLSRVDQTTVPARKVFAAVERSANSSCPAAEVGSLSPTYPPSTNQGWFSEHQCHRVLETILKPTRNTAVCLLPRSASHLSNILSLDAFAWSASISGIRKDEAAGRLVCTTRLHAAGVAQIYRNALRRTLYLSFICK
jgi:hypothetical protein